MSQQALFDSSKIKSPEINPDNTVTFRLYAPKAKEVTGKDDAVAQTFVVKFDRPLGDFDYLVVVDVQGKKYGLGVEGKKNPDWTQVYFTLADGRQVDFVDGTPKTSNASAKLDLSSPSGTATITVYRLEGDLDTKTYPVDMEEIDVQTISLI